MNIVHGNHGYIYVKIDNVYLPIGCFETFTYSFKNEIILKTDVNAGLFRKKRVRISDGTLSMSGVFTLLSSDKIATLYFLQEGIRRSEIEMRLTYEDNGGNTAVFDGTWLIETINITNPVSDIDTFEIDFQQTGEVEISTTGGDGTPECHQTYSDWWTPSAAATSFSGAGTGGLSFAGQNIVEVVREAGAPLVFTSGTPGEREYSFDGTTIGVWASNPFDGTERVFVIWQATT